MKLLNILSITVMGTLFAVGCSSTTTITSDGGPSEGGTTDTGVKVDTGVKTDSGTSPTDTGGGTVKCADCQKVYCKAQNDACMESAAIEGCNNLITCINGCAMLDAGASEKEACGNRCITESTSTEGKALIGCISECLGSCEM